MSLHDQTTDNGKKIEQDQCKANSVPGSTCQETFHSNGLQRQRTSALLTMLVYSPPQSRACQTLKLTYFTNSNGPKIVIPITLFKKPPFRTWKSGDNRPYSTKTNRRRLHRQGRSNVNRCKGVGQLLGIDLSEYFQHYVLSDHIVLTDNSNDRK